MNKEELLIAITKELQLYNKVSLHTMGNISDLIDRYHQSEVKKLDKPVVSGSDSGAVDTVAEREAIKKEFGWLTPEKAARLTKPIKWDAGKSSEGQP